MLNRSFSERVRRSIARPRQFVIGPETDSRQFLELFALVFEDLRTRVAATRRRFEITPASLLVWAARSPPSLEDLRVGDGSTAPPNNWPDWARTRWAHLRGGLFLRALDSVVKNAEQFEIHDGAEACRLLAAIAQTLLTERADLRAHNLGLVHRYYPAARQRKGFSTDTRSLRERSPLLQKFQTRLDERGERVETGALTAWYASHPGPHYALKSQNQDATNVASHGASLIFALADGVSTSTGARFAATAIVMTFCDSVKRMLLATRPPDIRCLIDAVHETQRALDDLVRDLLARWEAEDFSELYDPLPRESALKILQNTVAPTRARVAPALAATLIGGVVVGEPGSDRVTAHVVRLGDGIVEHIRGNAEIATVFDMDRTDSALDTLLAPGPHGRGAVDRIASASVHLEPADLLLVSSDGLARGHKQPVWRKLCDSIRQDSRINLNYSSDVARVLLDEMALAADQLHDKEPSSNLFNDNLSLVLISCAPLTE